jgi:hypothetical protein
VTRTGPESDLISLSPVPVNDDEKPRDAYQRVSDRLRQIDAQLSVLDAANGTELEKELLELVESLEELGLVRLLAGNESAPVTPDNLPEVLSDRAGIAALRATLRTLAKLASSRGTLGPEGWESSEWDVVLVRAAEEAEAEGFAHGLCFELGNQYNLAAFYAPERVTPDEQDVYPAAGVTATNDPAFREWTLSWGGALLWWEEATSGLRMRLETVGAQGPMEEFPYGAMKAAAHWAAELIAERLPELEDVTAQLQAETVTIDEHRALEATLRIVVEQSETAQLSAEDRTQLDVLIEMLQLQLRAPRPDRPIIGRILRGLAIVGGGLLLGVAGNYLTDLMHSFGVPWP